ncbi:MAG: mismatch repair protein [Acidobacteriaceae bacterium]
MKNPSSEYKLRLTSWESAADRYERRHLRLGRLKLALAGVALVLCWRYRTDTLVLIAGLLTSLALLLIINILHGRILRQLQAARRCSEVYRKGLMRLECRWAGNGDKGEQFYNPRHLYAKDLDILGEGSLYELLCTCRTRMGKICLAEWLLAPSGDVSVIKERQDAIRELHEKIEFREGLATAGGADQIEPDPIVLVQWAVENSGLNYRRWWPFSIALALASAFSISYGMAFDWLPFLNVLAVCLFVNFALRRKRNLILGQISTAARDLTLLGQVIERMEREAFQSPALQKLQTQLAKEGIRASDCVAKLGLISDLEKSRRNMFVRALDQPLMYSTLVACALERWRTKYGKTVRLWLDAVGELECLVALGTYSFEHPKDVFPQFESAEGGNYIVGRSLGHPLVAPDTFVTNDLRLDKLSQILLVSGSNMSGKSTYLRVVGINAVLAMMGGPVRAAEFRLTPITIGASLQIVDSLQEGVSHFYAEVRRIRDIVEVSARSPLLFLFDEVLQGTNSHDRRIGAEGILRTLLDQQSIGLVTTHDLALTEIENQFPDRIKNVHFQESLTAGKLSFDFSLREGAVTSSNGVELMRSMGLKV